MPRHASQSMAASSSAKRQRQSSIEEDESAAADHDASMDQDPESAKAANGNDDISAKTGGIPGQSSTFRSVSACNRCRLRKNRCDQKLPSCATCERARVPCVGFDPITKQEVPRSYIYYLETRVHALEQLLTANNIAYPPAQNLELCSRPTADSTSLATATGPNAPAAAGQQIAGRQLPVDALKAEANDRSPAMVNIVSTAKPKSLASTSGVSFARVVFAAVQHSVTDGNGGTDRSQAVTTMRDSFFGLHTRPTITPAPFPPKNIASKLISLYFEHSNPQIPILHRDDFLRMFERAYQSGAESLSARELYMLNMVFAIGSGVIVGEPVRPASFNSTDLTLAQIKEKSTPEQYHASAIVHLEACLSQSGGYLEVLQAILLLANFALLRPVPPGLWYITGVAVRLAVDLGLHHEEGGDADQPHPTGDPQIPAGNAAQEKGRRLWIRDMRRRLFWCTYSFDRLVSTCVGRPFGISDDVITTSMPSALDDSYITTTGFLEVPPDVKVPSYKYVGHHYFRLRMLQSEILQVLQHNHAQMTRENNAPTPYPERRTNLPSPFLADFDSFYDWRASMDERLHIWKQSAPSKDETGVAFSTEFLELNYWQAVIMLYRQSLSIPAEFHGEYNTSNEVNSPSTFTAERREDEDAIYIKVAEAGHKILRIYRKLHLDGLVSYTYLSTHNLFMAGISFLYALWHSPFVRSRFTMEDVDFTILAGKSVLNDMIDKCPPAETCRDAFDRTAKATVKMANSTGGFRSHKSKSRKQRGRAATSASLPAIDPASTGTGGSGQRGSVGEATGFNFEFATSENLSSPSRSTGGEMSSSGTPPMGSSDGFGIRVTPGDMSGTGTGDGSMGHSHTSSPSLTRNLGQNSSAFVNQNASQTLLDPMDPSGMEFLQNLGPAPSDFGTMDPMDLGFGLPWDRVNNDFGDGSQTLNPFEPFFFGAPSNSNNNNNRDGQ